MGGGRGVDPMEHLLAIIPEEAKLTPLVASSIVIGSSLQVFSRVKESGWESRVRIEGIKAPVYDIYSAPGGGFEVCLPR
jgi:hypothetical protein